MHATQVSKVGPGAASRGGKGGVLGRANHVHAFAAPMIGFIMGSVWLLNGLSKSKAKSDF